MKKPKIPRAERKAEKKFRKGRHRLVMATVFFNDQTYLTKVIDLNRDPKTVEFEGVEYTLPETPLKMNGWWPFKARTPLRKIFRDDHYCVDWREGNPEAVSLVGAHATAEYNKMLPSTFAAMVRENLHSNMFLSMKKKNALGMDNKMLIIILAVIGVVGFVALYMMGVI